MAAIPPKPNTNTPAGASRPPLGREAILPHQAHMQRAFAPHTVGGVRAHTGGAARVGQAIGAQAFAQGGQVRLAPGAGGQTIGHEAAHVVQQRGGGPRL